MLESDKNSTSGLKVYLELVESESLPEDELSLFEESSVLVLCLFLLFL